MARWLQYVIFAAWVIALASTPLWASNYIVRLAIMIAMFTALTLSWNFIGGFTGYPSFSTAAFFGLGCYAGALSQRAGVPMVLAWGIATLVVGAFAAALGAIILRLQGHYFAIGSIGVVEVVRLVISSWGSLTGGGDGLNLPLLSGGPNAVARIFLLVMILIMVAVFLITIVVDRSRLGFGLRCIQQNEDAANMVGVNTTLVQGHRLYALGAVLRNRRRRLRLVDGLHRPERFLLHHHVHQGAGDVPARRAGHRLGSGRGHRRVHAA